MIVTAGKADVSVYFYIVQDASGASPGEPKTGLVFSDIETGGSASYMRQGAARTDFQLFTLGSASAAHTDGGFILVDDTNMPGIYRCDIPDAACVTGVDEVTVALVVEATNNAAVSPLKVQILDVDLRDAVNMGITALPNAAANAAGGVLVSAAGSLDMDALNVNIDDIETDTGTTLQAELDAIQVAVITNAAGVDIAADIIAIKAETANIVADTGELQVDDIPGTLTTIDGKINTIDTNVDDIEAALATLTNALILTSAVVETVTDTTNYIIPATADATDDDAYNEAVAVFIDGTDPNQKSYRRITNYVASTRTITVDSAPDFVVTTSDVLTVLAVGKLGTTLGSPAGVSLAADIAAIKSETATIVADTGELQVDDVPGLIAALNDLSAANINSEVVDVLKTDVMTLPGQEAPPLTPTIEEAISWLYKVLRNRTTQTATTWSLYDDAETTVDAKATVSDDATTAIVQEIVTGP